MQKLNICIGRFQPLTQGHLNMINEGEAPCIVYRINSNKPIEQTKTGIKISSKKYTKDTISRVIDYIDNPIGELTEQEKELLKRPFNNALIEEELNIIKKYNSNILDIVLVTNVFDALGRFNSFCIEHKNEYEPQYLMCGDDRVDQYSKLINQYDELETELKSGITAINILKNKLKCNTGNGRIKGVSGTEVRKSILNNNKELFCQIMPKNIDLMFDDFKLAFDNFREQLTNFIN